MDRDVDNEERLEHMIRRQTSKLPENVKLRLAAMREAALEELHAPNLGMAGRHEGHVNRIGEGLRRLMRFDRPGGGAALAGAALLVVIGVGVLLNGSSELLEMPMVSEPEVAIVQDLELLEELEFLAWLEEEAPGAG
jgi:hypothetical protein